MAKIDSTIATIAVAGVAAAAVSAMLLFQPKSHGPDATEKSLVTSAVQTGSTKPAKPEGKWATSATGRIEPKGGEVRVSAPVGGEIARVLVVGNDRVFKGDLMVLLDDADHLARVAAAEAEADVRRRERDDESKVEGGVVIERRKATDAAEFAERELFRARQAFDAMLMSSKDGQASPELGNLRQLVIDKEKLRDDALKELARVASLQGMPLPDRLESALTIARTDLRLAYQALERTRIRAPSDGTVLRVFAKAGELAGPSAELPLLTFGDLSQIKVRAEVEERDLGKVRIGQRVVVRSDAFPDKDFIGQVTAIAPALGAPAIVTRGPRRPNDVDVLEVVATLENAAELVTGMRVDVFFTHPETAETKP